jgi:hypothetical protein
MKQFLLGKKNNHYNTTEDYMLLTPTLDKLRELKFRGVTAQIIYRT